MDELLELHRDLAAFFAAATDRGLDSTRAAQLHARLSATISAMQDIVTTDDVGRWRVVVDNWQDKMTAIRIRIAMASAEKITKPRMHWKCRLVHDETEPCPTSPTPQDYEDARIASVEDFRAMTKPKEPSAGIEPASPPYESGVVPLDHDGES